MSAGYHSELCCGRVWTRGEKRKKKVDVKFDITAVTSSEKLNNLSLLHSMTSVDLLLYFQTMNRLNTVSMLLQNSFRCLLWIFLQICWNFSQTQQMFCQVGDKINRACSGPPATTRPEHSSHGSRSRSRKRKTQNAVIPLKLVSNKLKKCRLYPWVWTKLEILATANLSCDWDPLSILLGKRRRSRDRMEKREAD